MKFAVVAAALLFITLGQSLAQRSFRTNPLFGGIPQFVCAGRGCARQARGGVTYQIRPESTIVLPVHRRTPGPVKLVPATSVSVQQHTARDCPAGRCVFYTDCQARSSPTPNHLCLLPSGYTGVCCQSASGLNVNLTTRHGYGQSQYPNRGQPQYIQIDTTEIRKITESWASIERDMVQNQIFVRPNTVEFSHNNFFGGSDVSLVEAQSSIQAVLGFSIFSKRERLTPQQIRESNFDLRNTNLANSCGPTPNCDAAWPYRNPDGTCNNLRSAAQGKAIGTFSRLLPAEYADGISEPKRATDGGELPNARLISITISPDGDLPSDKYSLLLTAFGQFVDHDMTRTAVTRTQSGGSISCCDQRVLASTRFQHPACLTIPVPNQDTFLRGEQQSCIDFVRSAPSVNPKCRFGPREQLNQLSAYIDGNNIYGASQATADSLREFRGGRLKVSRISNEEFLPQNSNDTGCQLPKTSQRKCFLAGDGRANEVVDLTVVHNVWLREHNRIARVLAQLNPEWNDELLYQETKRIVVAELQHVIYSEYLPLIVGPRAYAHFELGLSSGFTDFYNPNIDASIINEFATAAYRLHSLVAGTLNLQTNRRIVGQVLLRDQFNNPGLLYDRGGYEMRISSLTGQAIQRFDNFFSRELTNHLFQIPGKRFGLDLVALNIQRGRDHGIPGYIKYRDLCGLSPVRSFDDLRRIFSNPQVPDVMSQLYRSVEDIDLFIAGTSEKRMPGAVVGPTFACIIGEQFKRVKEGDRFWYENANQVGSFTARQLAEIKKTSMARILCDNSAISEMQPNAFLMPHGQQNPKLPCDGYDIPRVNLEAWSKYHHK